MSDQRLDALLGRCTCIAAYKNIGRIDPQCQRCDCEEDVGRVLARLDRAVEALREIEMEAMNRLHTDCGPPDPDKANFDVIEKVWDIARAALEKVEED